MVLDIQTVHHILKNTAVQNVNKPFVYITDLTSPLSYFWRNCHVLMCLRARFNISKPMIISYSHKKYEYKQVWSLLQYRELGHQNMKNN